MVPSTPSGSELSEKSTAITSLVSSWILAASPNTAFYPMGWHSETDTQLVA